MISTKAFEKVAVGIAPILRRLTRTATSSGLEKKILRHRIDSYLQSKTGVTPPSGDSGQKRRRRVPA